MNNLRISITVLLLSISLITNAANKVTVTSGNWSDGATWGGTVPVAGDNVTISAGHTVTINVNPPSIVNVTVNGTLRFDATGVARTWTITGTLTINNGGSFSCVAPGSATTHTLTYNGTAITNNGVFNMVNGSNLCNVILGGSAAQTVAGTNNITFNKLRLSNTGGSFAITYAAGNFVSAINNPTRFNTSFTCADSLDITRGMMILNSSNNSTLTHTVGFLRMGSARAQ